MSQSELFKKEIEAIKNAAEGVRRGRAADGWQLLRARGWRVAGVGQGDEKVRIIKKTRGAVPEF